MSLLPTKRNAEQTPRAGLFRGTTLFARQWRASMRSKGRTPHNYSIRRTASKATFTLRLSGQLFSHELPSLLMRKRYSSSSTASLQLLTDTILAQIPAFVNANQEDLWI